MIPQITEINFPEYATLQGATVSLVDMGESNIQAQVKIDGKVTPDFSTPWEVLFRGQRFILTTQLPQAQKGNELLDTVFELSFQDYFVHQLKRHYFVTLEPQGASWGTVDKYIASVSLNLYNFVSLLNGVLNHYFGDEIRAEIDDSFSYPQEPSTVSISNSHIWDVLGEVYKIYNAKWKFVYTDDGRCIIRIGVDPELIEHIFSYGHDGGLTKIERQVPNEGIYNWLLGRGGSKNLPYRYFKATDKNNQSFPEDPDWVPELSNIYFSELRDSAFRSYVQGWKAAHYGGSVKRSEAAVGWAYDKGRTDKTFDPVEYVKDDESIARYGVLENALDNQEGIYPTIQGVYGIDALGEAIGRVDELVDVEEIVSDETKADVNAQSSVRDLPEMMKSVSISPEKTLTFKMTSRTFEIPKGMVGNVDFSPKAYGENAKYITFEDCRIVVKKPDGSTIPASGIPEGTGYQFEVEIDATNTSDDVAIYVKIGDENPKVKSGTGKTYYSKTWDIWIKNIWGTTKDPGETPTKYAERVWGPLLGDREKNEAAVMFSDGMLSTSEDYQFTIIGIPALDETRSIRTTTKDGGTIEVKSYWRITLGKSDSEIEASGLYIPSTGIHANAGEHFYLVGIDMPRQYMLWAEKRLTAFKQDVLAKHSQTKPTWLVNFDVLRINGQDRLIDDLMPGRTMRLADPRLISEKYSGTGKAYETRCIQSVTYTFRTPSNSDAALYPDVEVVVGDEFAATSNPIETLSGEISALQQQIGSTSNIERWVRVIADRLYLRKDGRKDLSVSPTEFANLLSSQNFRSGTVGGQGWGFFRDENGYWVLEVDSINVRRDLQVNNLVVTQIQARGGLIVESCASIEEVTQVEVLDSGNYRCYFDNHNFTLGNLFRAGDIGWCSRFEAGAPTADVRQYKRRVVSAGLDYIDLSATVSDSLDIPAAGDCIVQFGSYTDANRRFAKIRDVLGGGYERYIEGLDSVTATGEEYYFVGRQAGQHGGRPRFFLGDKDSWLKYENGKLSYRGDLDLQSTYGGASLGDVIEKAANDVKVSLEENIRTLQNQIDGVIETFNGPVDPLLTNYPASNWQTEAERQRHIGDVYFNVGPYDAATNPNSGSAWRWYVDSPTEYGWIKIADSDAVKALQLAHMSVIDTDVFFTSSNSAITQPQLPEVDSVGAITNLRGWSTIAPQWQRDKYIWQSTYVRKGDGEATFTDPTCISGHNGLGIVSIKEMYYLSTSRATLQGGSWEYKRPDWVAGKYYWIRSEITYTDGTVQHTAGICVTGEQGNNGDSPYLLDIDNEVIAVACDSSGAQLSVWPICTARVWHGASQVTQSVKYSIISHNGISSAAIDKNGLITFGVLQADTAIVAVQAEVGAVVLQANISIYKVRPGADGSSAVIYSILPSTNSITRSMDGTLSDTEVSCSVYKGTGASPLLPTPDHTLTYKRLPDGATGILEHPDGISDIVYIQADTEAVIFELKDGDITLDRQRVPVLSDSSGLDIGGTNLLRNTDFLDGTENWRPVTDAIFEIVAQDDVNGLFEGRRVARFSVTEDNAVWKSILQPVWNMIPGRVHTFSGNALIPDLSVVSGSCNIVLRMYHQGGGQTDVTVASKNDFSNGQWKHLQKTFLVPYDVYSIYVMAQLSAKGTILVNSWKFEPGNVATSWTAAPEDTNYLRTALRESTQIKGGLVAATLIELGFTDSDGEYKIMSGLNGGIIESDRDTALWAGGTIDNPTYELRHDGTFSACKGTVRAEDSQIAIGENVVLDENGLKLFDSSGNVRLRVANTTVGNTLVATAVQPNGSLPAISETVKINAETKGAGAISTTPNLYLEKVPDLSSAYLSSLSEGSVVTATAKFQIATDKNLPSKRNPVALRCFLSLVRSSKTVAIVYGDMERMGDSVVGLTLNLSTTVKEQGVYYLQAGLLPTLPPSSSAAWGTGNLQIGGSYSATLGFGAGTFLGSDGLFSMWNKTSILVKDNFAGMRCGDYGIQFTPSGAKVLVNGKWQAADLSKLL